jgi:hypothetical protein
MLKKGPLPTARSGGEYFDYIAVDADARRAHVSHGTEVDVHNMSAGLGLTIPGSASTDRNNNFCSREKK